MRGPLRLHWRPAKSISTESFIHQIFDLVSHAILTKNSTTFKMTILRVWKTFKSESKTYHINTPIVHLIFWHCRDNVTCGSKVLSYSHLHHFKPLQTLGWWFFLMEWICIQIKCKKYKFQLIWTNSSVIKRLPMMHLCRRRADRSRLRATRTHKHRTH